MIRRRSRRRIVPTIQAASATVETVPIQISKAAGWPHMTNPKATATSATCGGRPPAAQEVPGLERDGHVEDRPDAAAGIAEELDRVGHEDRGECERGRRSPARQAVLCAEADQADQVGQRDEREDPGLVRVLRVRNEREDERDRRPRRRTRSQASARAPPDPAASRSELLRLPRSEAGGRWRPRGRCTFTDGVSVARIGRFNAMSGSGRPANPASVCGKRPAASPCRRRATRWRSS